MKHRSVQGTSDLAAPTDLMLGLMRSVISFMRRTGMSNSDIARIFDRALSSPKVNKKAPSRSEEVNFAYGCDTIAGAVLRAWHKLPEYVDSAARPISLRANGTGPSLASLILSQNRNADANAVTRSMLKAGLLKKKGAKSFLPAKDSATVASLDPVSIDHIAKTVIRLVETASQNISKSKGKVSLIERYAHVPNLAKSEASAFADFSRQQGQACLDAIEDWLESRQLKQPIVNSTRPELGMSAGVHVFAYLGNSPVVSKRGDTLPRTKRPTPAREARA